MKINLEKIRNGYFKEALNIRQKALELSMSGIVFADLSGKVIYANKAFFEMWGYTDNKEVLGIPIALFLQNEELAWKVLWEANRTGNWSGVMKGKRADGSLFDVQASICMFSGENDEPVCHMASFSDTGQQQQNDIGSRQQDCNQIQDFIMASLAVNSDKFKTLTVREREVLILTGQGHTSRQIASKFSISPRTVETHRFNLMQKLDIHTHAGLISYAVQKKLLLLEK